VFSGICIKTAQNENLISPIEYRFNRKKAGVLHGDLRVFFIHSMGGTDNEWEQILKSDPHRFSQILAQFKSSLQT